MGAADIVPGVSGGTMAFILGIYEDLISSIALFGTKEFWMDIRSGKIKEAILLPRWGFLIPLGLGIVSAGVSLAGPLEHALETRPTFVWSFFFGLVAASIVVVARRVQSWDAQKALLLTIGTVIAYFIVGLVPVQTPEAPWFLVLSGAIAICAMILPGISGAFILVLLGKYEFVLSAINNRDIVSILYIWIGATVGIITFSQVLKRLFARYHDAMVALLTGLMIGSLRKIWPWKAGEENLLPSMDAFTPAIVGLILLGVVIVVMVEVVAHKKK